MSAQIIQLPEVQRGRRTAARQALFDQQLEEFAKQILEINSRLDFRVSARGWCYILEEYGLTKGDFGNASKRINECRKKGLLPRNIVADDKARETINLEAAVDEGVSPEEYAETIKKLYIDEAYDNAIDRIAYYKPHSFWEDKDIYIEMMVEKVDLKSLFKEICHDYFIPLTNFRGWSDLNSRGGVMDRFAKHERAGRQCILLYCGDHDPGGLHISDYIRSNMEEMELSAGWHPRNLQIDRFGLNYDFIIENNLSWVENLETSSASRLDNPKHQDHKKPYVQNYIKQFGVRKVEANALVTRPDAGRRLCREAIEKYLSVDSINKYWHIKNDAVGKARAHLEWLMS